MTTIVNAYSGNESIANNLRSMADSLFGDQARQEVLRQEAQKYARENDASERGSHLLATGDYPGFISQAFRAGRHGEDTGQFTRADAANRYGVNSDQFNNAAGAAGQSYNTTPRGFWELQAAETARNAATNQSRYDIEKYKHDYTPYAGYDANGNPLPVTSQAKAVQGAVYPALTETQAKGALIRRAPIPGVAPSASAPSPGVA